MSEKTVLKFQNVYKSYKNNLALQDISLNLTSGKIYGIIGAAGAGKTTLLNLCMGFEKADSGLIEICGLAPTNEKNCIEIKKRVGYVPHEICYYPKLKVEQLVNFSRKIYPKWDDDKFRRHSAILNVPLTTQIACLSHIEKVKLALCIALCYHPQLLILDDPTASLDPIARHEFHTAIDHFLQNQEMTTLFATHVIDDVEKIAEQVFVLQNGKLKETFDVKSIKEKFSRVSIFFDTPPSQDLQLHEARYIRKGAREWIAVFENHTPQEVENILHKQDITDFVFLELSLEQLFVEMSLHTYKEGN